MATTEFGDPVVESAVTEFGDPVYAPSDAPPRIEVRGTSADESDTRSAIVRAAETIGAPFARAGEAIAGGIEDLGVGIAHGGAGIVKGADKAITSALGAKYAQPQETPDLDAAYERTGPLGGVGNVIPEIALTAAPIARAGGAVARMLPRALGARAAPLVGDVVANAGYESGKAAAQGEDPGRAALLGGGGAVAGRAVGNVAGRVWNGITPEARTLLQNGITPTPGQAFGGEGIVAGGERLLSNLPLAGAAVDRAKRRAMGQYSEAEIDQALRQSGIPHEGSGFKAVRQINDQINAAYERVKPQTFLEPQDVKRAAGQTRQAVASIPLLTQQQGAEVARYYNQKIVPQIQRAEQAGTSIDGATAKSIDAEIGDLARQYAHSPDPKDHPLGMAFYALQSNMRDALKSNDPQVLQMLQQVNGAYKRMLPINIATERATGTRGQFTPDQFRAASTRSKVPGYDPRLALNDAARETLNEPGTGLARSLSRNLGVPGLGAAASVGAHAMGVPPEAIAAANAAIAVGGTGIAHALYSEPGIRMTLAAMDLIPRTRAWVSGLPPEKQQEFIMRMLAESPVSTKQALARVGSHLAAQQPVGATP